MVFFVFAGEEGVAYRQLVEDAAEGPHVDGRRVGDTQHDFRRAVESALDVRVDFLVLEAAATKVNDLDSRLGDFAEENVFGFEVTVDDLVLSHVVERDQDLNGETLYQTQREALKVVHLYEIIQVDAQ